MDFGTYMMNLDIDPIVLTLIGTASLSIVIGFSLFLSLLSSNKKHKKKTILDDDYIENIREAFNNTGTIEGSLEQMQEIYAGNAVIQERLKKSLNFIQNQYGDYETALLMINLENNGAINHVHEIILREVINKSEPLVNVTNNMEQIERNAEEAGVIDADSSDLSMKEQKQDTFDDSKITTFVDMDSDEEPESHESDNLEDWHI